MRGGRLQWPGAGPVVNASTMIVLGPAVLVHGETLESDGGTSGLIDAHYHAAFATLPAAELATADPGYIHIHAAIGAEEALSRSNQAGRPAVPARPVTG